MYLVCWVWQRKCWCLVMGDKPTSRAPYQLIAFKILRNLVLSDVRPVILLTADALERSLDLSSKHNYAIVSTCLPQSWYCPLRSFPSLTCMQ